MKHIFLICLIAFSITIQAQKPSINLDEPYLKSIKKHQLIISDTSYLYVNDGDSKMLFYYTLVPKNAIKGVLIILPSTWELAEDAFNNNKKLAELAFSNGIMTVVPSINFNLCMDETAFGFLNATFVDVLEKYKPPQNKIVIGGFSLGGMNAIRYTEAAYQDSTMTRVKPVAVYGVDPPLDLESLYYTFSRTAKRSKSKAGIAEASSYLERMETQFGGNPEKYPERYAYYSMYSRNQLEGGNAKYLRTIPVRIYSDPDIEWNMKNRNADLYDMNALNQTAMINDLQQMGNHSAEFINALGKGIRPNGIRHPHSWSIVEPIDCMKWILKCLN